MVVVSWVEEDTLESERGAAPRVEEEADTLESERGAVPRVKGGEMVPRTPDMWGSIVS